jgi:hypothetical protein
VPDGHHDLSHHGKKPEKLEALAKINRFQVEQLRGLPAAAGRAAGRRRDLLANSLVVFGSGARRRRSAQPRRPAGGAGRRRRWGGAKGRLTCVLPGKETPMANLYLAILRTMGGKDERFADSTEPLPLR